MNWYNLLTYLLFPVAVLGYLSLAYYLNNDDTVTFSLLFSALFGSILIYGLLNKTTWSWKFLIISYILNISFSKIDIIDEIGIIQYLIIIGVANFIFTYPNYIYFKKREHLFVN